jgi:benzoate membrane transport protein
MKSPLQLSHIAAGLTAVVVGYSSSVILVIEAARLAGASPAQIISWLVILGLGMGLTCIVLSIIYKMPIVTAWSTPGAAFLISSVAGFSLAEVTGAFIISALLSLVTAQFKPLIRGIERIPPTLSAAMLAGILLPFCLKIFGHAQEAPSIVLIFLAVYLIGSRWFAKYLMLMLLVLATITAAIITPNDSFNITFTAPTLLWVTPEFSLSAAIGLAFPLFLITMLSQNLPGIAILHSHQYHPNSQTILRSVAGLQLVTAPLGGFTYNLAAITAAICMGENAGNKPQYRYLAAIMAGVAYIVAGLLAGTVVLIFTQMPSVITHLLAGLALLATLQGSLEKSMADPRHRQAAILTLLCSASGIIIAGISAPVWGLSLGLLMLLLQQKNSKLTLK